MTTLSEFDADYNQPVIDSRSYEYEEGDTIRNSRRDAINSYYGINTGRNFSEYLSFRNWRIDEIAALQMSRFDNGEGEIIGRDIIITHGIDSEIVRDMMYRLFIANNKQFGNVAIEFAVENGDTWNVRYTATGKRTWHGEKDHGMGHEKKYQPKQYRRNRRGMGF